MNTLITYFDTIIVIVNKLLQEYTMICLLNNNSFGNKVEFSILKHIYQYTEHSNRM